MSEPLSRQELDALEEIGKPMHADRDYWWRQASMRKLEARGFVRRRPGSETAKIASWEITYSGRNQRMALQTAKISQETTNV
jgi:hypothetical protein